MTHRIFRRSRELAIGAALLSAASNAIAQGQTTEIISLNHLRELVEKSFDVQAGKANVIEHRARVIRSFDPYLPDVSLNAQTYAFAESYRENRSPVFISAGMSLFDRGKDIFGIQKARSELRASEQKLEAERKDALIRAYELYFQVGEAKANIRSLIDLKKELEAVLERARAMVAAKALANRQLLRIEVEVTLIENRLESSRAALEASKSRLTADLQLDPNISWDVPQTSKSTIPREYLSVKEDDLSRASGAWNRALYLAENSYNLDTPTRWLAYSDQLPRLGVRASVGRADFNTVRNEMAINATLEIPIPIFNVPIMLKPINTIINQNLRENEVRRAEVLADLRANIEARTARLNAALTQLQLIEKPLETCRLERSQERQEILAAGGQAFQYLMFLAQVRDLELARNSALRARETEYNALRVLRGELER